MAKKTTAQLKKEAEVLGIDISSATTNSQRQEMIDEAMNKEVAAPAPPTESGNEAPTEGVNEEAEESTEEEVEEESKDYSEQCEIKDSENFGEKGNTDDAKYIVLVKGARVNLDRVLQFGEIFLGDKSDFCESVFKAKCWLGKLLGCLGSENPYKTKEPVKNASEIPPTADVAETNESLHKFDLLDKIDKVTLLRDTLEKVIAEGNDFRSPTSREEAIAVTQFYVHASEARFELGKILGLIRESKF